MPDRRPKAQMRSWSRAPEPTHQMEHICDGLRLRFTRRSIAFFWSAFLSLLQLAGLKTSFQ
jgi:hypothetical protein